VPVYDCRVFGKRANRMWPMVDPYEDWKDGLGELFRYRYLLPIVAIEFGGAAWAFQRIGPSWGVPICAVIAVFAAVAWYLRVRWIQELQIGVAFHGACHFIRDSAAKLEELYIAGKKDEYFVEHDKLHNALANRIADYFQRATRDTTVNCAIRLAFGDPGNISYITKGRSDGMDLNRKDVSRPIPSDKGLARKLMDEGERGVCHVVDINDAIANNWWMPCPSDKFTDVRFLMVAPINWYDASAKKTMGGILY